MNVLGAIVAGIVGTAVMTLMMNMAPKMGMPKMDVVGMMGSMFDKDGNKNIGLAMHFMMGIVFAIVYALLWNAGIGGGSTVGGLILTGAIFGAVHWLIAGLMMGGMPMMHAGIKAGNISNPGLYMMNNGGMMAFMGGLLGHVVYGIVVALVYGLIF